MNIKIIFASYILMLFCSCSNAISQTQKITDFESCVAAGNRILRSYPPKCIAPGIGTFTQVIAKDSQPKPKLSEPLRYETSCKNACGDGQCAEMVCQEVGCPCAETADNCAKDCKK